MAGEIKITNLRSSGVIDHPWEVPGKNLEALITPLGASEVTDEGRRISLRLSLQKIPSQAKVLSVRSLHPEIQFTHLSSATALSRNSQFQLDYVAPWECSVKNPREEIKVEVRYQWKGRVYAEELSVDDRCILGEPQNSDPEAIQVAEMAARFRQDPMVQKLIRQASLKPRGTVAQEVQLLKKMIDFNAERHIAEDPLGVAPGWLIGMGYVLSPTQTLRYGGDCEDWTILTGAYFAERGFAPMVELIPGHVRLRVEGHGVDFRDDNPQSIPHHIAPVIPPHLLGIIKSQFPIPPHPPAH